MTIGTTESAALKAIVLSLVAFQAKQAARHGDTPDEWLEAFSTYVVQWLQKHQEGPSFDRDEFVRQCGAQAHMMLQTVATD